jgi:hypothetical protein
MDARAALARLAPLRNGFDRAIEGSSRLPDRFPELLRAIGIRRINLTLRRVTVPG